MDEYVHLVYVLSKNFLLIMDYLEKKQAMKNLFILHEKFIRNTQVF